MKEEGAEKAFKEEGVFLPSSGLLTYSKRLPQPLIPLHCPFQ